MYHYGWIRSEEQMNRKSEKVNGYWDKAPQKVDYSQIDNTILRAFSGDHPAAISQWLPSADGLFETDLTHTLTKKEIRHRIMLKLESLLGLELSKKHFKLVQ